MPGPHLLVRSWLGQGTGDRQLLPARAWHFAPLGFGLRDRSSDPRLLLCGGAAWTEGHLERFRPFISCLTARRF